MCEGQYNSAIVINKVKCTVTYLLPRVPLRLPEIPCSDFGAVSRPTTKVGKHDTSGRHEMRSNKVARIYILLSFLFDYPPPLPFLPTEI